LEGRVKGFHEHRDEEISKRPVELIREAIDSRGLAKAGTCQDHAEVISTEQAVTVWAFSKSSLGGVQGSGKVAQ
jgi:hypothetical protein